MGKNQQYVVQGKQRHSARKHIFPSPPAQSYERQNEKVRLQQIEEIFVTLPQSIIACNREGKILWLNPAALKLFNVPSELQCRGRNFDEFLTPYISCSGHQQTADIRSCQGSSRVLQKSLSNASETFISLHMPSGRQIQTRVSCSSMRNYDAQKQGQGMVYVFCEISPQEREALQLQCVHRAVQALNESIAHIPEHFPEPIKGAPTAEPLLLSLPVVFIAQQLVNVIRAILDCPRVSVKAIGRNGYLYFIAGSGFSAEREQPEKAVSGRLTLTGVLGPSVVATLTGNKEIIIQGNQVYFPFNADHFASEKILLMPLFLEEHLAGLLCIIKDGLESTYTTEEIELVKAVSAHVVLLIQYLHAAQEQTEAYAKKQALQEVHHFSQEFLVLAGHELRTPLTGILGNVQLAQRRLDALLRQGVEQTELIQKQLVQAQRPLASASQSAQLQQRIINDIIDDGRLQAHQYHLYLQQCDLLTLLRTAVSTQRELASEHTIRLEMDAAPHKVFVLADPERLTRVFNTYLENALAYSPPDKPVTVEVQVEEGSVRVAVHNEGSSIPPEEQKHLWERFYRSKANTVQNELDLSLGLRLYLCRACIEHHGGQVGVQSEPGHGTTFWFTVPIMTDTSQDREKAETHDQ